MGDRIVFANAATKADLKDILCKPGEKHMVFFRGPESQTGQMLNEQEFARLPEECVAECNVGYDVCGICLDDWVAGEKAVRLPCGHHFHRDCCSHWLVGRSACCPLCQWAADCPRPCRHVCCGANSSTGDVAQQPEDDDCSDVACDGLPACIRKIRSSIVRNQEST